MKKSYTKPELRRVAPPATTPDLSEECDYTEQLVRFQASVIKAIYDHQDASELADAIAMQLTLAFSLGAHYGFRLCEGQRLQKIEAARDIWRRVDELRDRRETVDPAGEPHAR
jgi:hypothetical protein